LHAFVKSASALAFLTLFSAMGEFAMANAEPTAPIASEKDHRSIEELVVVETDAWNRGDAVAYAAHFALDGGFTNVLGMVYYGRQAFEERHAELFKTIYKGSVLKQTIGKLRFIRSDIAIVDINVELTGYLNIPGGVRTEADHVGRAKLQMVLVKEKDVWWITAYHNVSVTPLPVRP
jgi:uncharacterized protein (TIGR02246 family)